VGFKKAKIKVMTGEGLSENPSNGEERRLETDNDDRNGVVSLVDEAFSVNGPSDAGRDEKTEQKPKTNKNKQLSEKPVKLGLDILERIVRVITDDTSIAIEEDDEKVRFQINGGNSSVLIGKKGQNLEAIQYIIDKVVNRHSDKRILVEVDVEDYFQKRKEKLVQLAERLAEKAKRTKKPSTLKQMNIQERRIIHLALKKDRGIRTQSIGDGYYRKLIIIPKKGNSGKQRPFNKNRSKVNAES
jgi:spoIIIJ-associated protein